MRRKSLVPSKRWCNIASKNPNLKKANTQDEYTYEQIQELKKCIQDPIYFIENYVEITHAKFGVIKFNLYEYQKEMIRSFHTERNTIVLSARQTGKALDLNTPIPTPMGWTTMGDIQIGDSVIGADGNPTRVTLATEVMHNHQCYAVEFSNGETIVADAEHKWKVNDTFTGRSIVLTTEEMVNRGNGPRPDGKSCRYSVNNTAPINFPDRELIIDPYVLGSWLGDGTSSRGEFTVEQNDISIYDHHQSLYEDVQIIPTKHREHILTVRIRPIVQQLKDIGVFKNKHIPMDYLRGSKKQRISLLQGLMDTNGTVDRIGGCELTLSDEQLARDAYELICSLGLKPTLHERTNSSFHTNSIMFTAYRDDFDVFRLDRKVCKQKQSPHPNRSLSTKSRSILSITPVKSVPVRCITVDNKDHLFLAGRGMIPTHNSETSAAYLLWFAMFHFDKTILIASRSNDHAMEMIQRIRNSYERMPMWLKPGVNEDGWNKHNLGFDNGSRIMSTATSENAGRGFTISLLYLDEFAFVSPNIQEEFWASISPTLATGGNCIMTSTPNGDMDLFSNLWRGANIPSADPNSKAGHNGFRPIRVRWDEPPGRDEAYKEEQVAKLGMRKWMQEFECVFLSSDALLISSIFLANITPQIEKVIPINIVNDVVMFREIQENGTYLIGIDPATGSGEDYSVITVFEFVFSFVVSIYKPASESSKVL